MAERLGTFEAFWPYYVSQHHHPGNRTLHVVGTAATLLCLAAALREPLFLLACPFMGYGFAWVGHFFVERNRPATFEYPLWSLRGDFRMFRLTLVGRMRAEVERAERLFPSRG
jgi:hypothetical protein